MKLPDAVVGVQVFPQLGGMGGMGGMGGGMGGMGGGMGGWAAAWAAARHGRRHGRHGRRRFGGGGLGGGGMGGGAAGGAGFFSIPAERTVSVPMTFGLPGTRQGQPEQPDDVPPRAAVRSSPTSPELPELLKLVGQNKIDRGAAQAAAWHIASGMSWEKIAAEKWDHVGRPDSPYFSQQQLMTGRMVVADVQAKAREKAKEDVAEEAKSPTRVAPKAE